MSGLECYECGRWVGVCQCTSQDKEKEMLIEKIKTDQVEARKARNTLAATLLTTLLGEANMVAKNAQRDAPTDEEVQAVVKKFLKGNLETQAALSKGGPDYRAYQMSEAIAEQAILESYLPQQLSEEELRQIVIDTIANGTPNNMGALMGYLKSNYVGKYDGKIASAVIKTVLVH